MESFLYCLGSRIELRVLKKLQSNQKLKIFELFRIKKNSHETADFKIDKIRSISSQLFESLEMTDLKIQESQDVKDLELFKISFVSACFEAFWEPGKFKFSIDS